MTLPLPRSAVLVAAAWVLACAAATLAGTAIVLAPAELARAWPLPGPAPGAAAAAGPAAAATAGAALLLMFAAAGHARARGWQGLFGGLVLVYPLLHAGLWFVLGAGPPGPAAWSAGAVLAAAVFALDRRGPRGLPPGPAPTPRRWRAADLLMIGLPVVTGLLAGNTLDQRAIVLSALTYPLFALLQLAVFMVVPARRLRAMGLGPTGTALACAAVFALLHWPQPAVLALTFTGMFVWTSAWLRGRALWRLALVMGLAATSASQFLPDAWTGHMRVGPGAVRAMAVRDLALEPGRRPVAVGAWLAETYPLTVGRPPAPGELDRWREAIAAEQRSVVAWQVLRSEEYAGRAAAGDLPPPAAHWQNLPPPWPDRIAAFGALDYFTAAGGDSAGFLAAVYGDLLGRRPAPAETAAWSWELGPRQRAMLARYLLSHRHRLEDLPFTAVAFPAPLLGDG